MTIQKEEKRMSQEALGMVETKRFGCIYQEQIRC